MCSSDLTVLMIAPSTPSDRVPHVVSRSQGFAYAQGRMSVTGLSSDEGRGGDVVDAIRSVSDIPVYIGVGISTAAQASAAAAARPFMPRLMHTLPPA